MTGKQGNDFWDTRLTLVSLVVIVGCFFFSWFGCYKFFKRDPMQKQLYAH
ncbi:hypothetical protein ACLK1T_21850 [Escherichia coli]